MRRSGATGTLVADSNNMRQESDLFDGMTVTWDDIRAWVQLYAPQMYTARMFHRYVRHWNIAHKIAQAKRRGDWPPTDASRVERP